MATIAISISKNLREKLGEEGTQEFVSVLNQISTAQLEEMERLLNRNYEKFQQELALLRSEFDKKLAEQRADILKWMFIFWSTTIITIVAGYILK